MPDPVYTIGLEYAQGSFTNVSNDCTRININKKLTEAGDSISEGRALFTLTNDNDQYSPNIVANSLSLNQRIRICVDYDTSSYCLFTGYIRRIKGDVRRDNKTITLEAADETVNLTNKIISTRQYSDVSPGSAFTQIFSLSNVSSFFVDDFGADRMSGYNAFNKTSGEAISELLNHGNYIFYVDGNNTINVKNQYWNLDKTSVNSYTEFYSLPFILDDNNVVNRQTIVGKVWDLVNSETVIASKDLTGGFVSGTSHIFIPASSTISFVQTFTLLNDPIKAISEELIIMTESLSSINSSDIGIHSEFSALDLPPSIGNGYVTELMSLYITHYNGWTVNTIVNPTGSGAWLNRYRIRGSEVTEVGSVFAEYEVNSSQQVYGIREKTQTIETLGDEVSAKSRAEFVVYSNKDAVDTIEFEIKNQYPDVLSNELIDVLSVINSDSNINGQYYVYEVTHDIDINKGTEHEVQYKVKQYTNPEYLILDHTTKGNLGQRKLGL